MPSVYLTPFPAVYRDFGGDEAVATTACLDAIDSLFSTSIAPESVACIVIEAVQGEGGYQAAPVAFLRGLHDRCREHGILLIADEVQSGYGRTGRMWAFEHAGIVPDVVCIAKAIANGLPLSAIATRRELQEQWGKSAHGSTFGGNPVACAAGIAVLETIHGQRLVENAAVRGAELRAGLERLAAEDPRIGDVRGPGLMVGVELVRDRTTREGDSELADALMARAADLGLLILTAGPAHQVIRWIAPLDVTAGEISEGLEIFGEALRTA
jgi:4-aminobutyrate aminotransferase